MTAAKQAVSERIDLAMDGCVPKDMLSYMKALGILKAIAERRDENAQGFWRDGDQWVVRSALDRDAALDFFMNEWQPTPIMSPWNKDSGFQPGKAAKAMEALNRVIAEESPRFDDWRTVCHESRLAAEEAESRFDKDKDKKDWILRKCRNGFPDSALEWFDAVFVLTDESSGASFPPLFGSGGNDGRLEMGTKHVLCVEQCLLNQNRAESEGWLESALFASNSPSIKNRNVKTIGLFDVEASSQSLINPWDFVLAMEGVLLFAGSASRRLGASSRSYVAFPFMVSSSAPAGSQTVSSDELGDKNKGEIWTPVWEDPASFRDVKLLMSEGRAEIGGRQAGNSVDFVRAISGLGVRRGISAFDRYGFLVRNGRANITAWLDRVPVPTEPPSASNALFDLDQPRRNIGSVAKTSAAMKSLGNRLEDAVYRFAKNGGGAPALQEVLLRVAEVERYAGKRRKEEMPPISKLQRVWEREANDGSSEFRLALSLASIVGEKGWHSIRENLEPVEVDKRGNPQWTSEPKGAFVWNALNDPLLNIAAVLERRCVDSGRTEDVKHPALGGKRFARLEDVVEFLHGRLDERRVGDLALALSMTAMGCKPCVLRPRREDERRRPPLVPPAYAAMKLTLLPRDIQVVNGRLVSIEEPARVPPEPALIPLLRADRVSEAYALASRRLEASTGLGVKTENPQIADGRGNGLRLAAALLFPISKKADSILADAALRPNNKETADEEE